MTTLLFVHGMNGTADSWRDIPEQLAPYVDDSTAIQLSGHNRPMTIFDVLGNGTYSSGLGMEDYVADVVNNFPAGQDRDVVLVGHSMGGAVISHVASRYPDRISKLIYLTAMLPDDGQSVSDILNWIRISGHFNADAFMGDFRPHIAELKLVLQPREPLDAKFSRSNEFENLPRAYIRCTDDDVIPTPIQGEMLNAYPGTEVKTLKRSHFPQYQAPKELVKTLIECLPT